MACQVVATYHVYSGIFRIQIECGHCWGIIPNDKGSHSTTLQYLNNHAMQCAIRHDPNNMKMTGGKLHCWTSDVFQKGFFVLNWLQKVVLQVPQGSKVVDIMYHLTLACVNGVKCYRVLAKESHDMFIYYLASILGVHISSNTMANLSRLCANLLECNLPKQ